MLLIAIPLIIIDVALFSLYRSKNLPFFDNVTPPLPTSMPVVYPSATPKPQPSATPKPQPSATPKPQPSATPKPQPSATPKQGSLSLQTATTTRNSTTALESLSIDNASDIVALLPSSSASNSGQPITHGLQLTTNAGGTIQLNGSYIQLMGTFYGDDRGLSEGDTFTIYDASGGKNGRSLFTYTFTTKSDTGLMNFSVRGVKAISFAVTGSSAQIDLVATLSKM